MNTRRLLIALLAAGMALASLAQAQRGPGRLADTLDLSEDQIAQLQAMRQEHRAQMEAHRESGERPSREEMQAVRQQHQEALAAILTPAQLQQLEELKAERGQRGGKGQGRHGHKGGGDKGRLGEALNLSDDQKAQLQTMRQEARQEMEARRENGQRPTREEMEAFRQQRHDALAAILTPEQLQQLEDIKAERGQRGGKGRRGGDKGRLGEALNLSDDQKAQLQTIRQEARQEMKARLESGERPSREEMEAFRQQRREAFEGILTPEQLQQLEDIKAERAASGDAGDLAPVSESSLSNTSVESATWGQVKESRK
ncbi:MAG: hypothetical protein GKR89_27540 [Candidatus Latescibacteria bacterium]|nr:hypothetical protein [Candidatus Latescibacterota bacterium]